VGQDGYGGTSARTFFSMEREVLFCVLGKGIHNSFEHIELEAM
jgi:hypothetical protein